MSQKENAARLPAPGIKIGFQRKSESNSNMLTHASAVKAELPFAAHYVAARYGIPYSLARSFVWLSGLGGGV